MTETLLVLLVGFTAISMYKLQSVPKHIAWTMRNGPAYQKALRQLRSVPGRVTNSEIHAVLESLDGHKVTWLGFKEFRLRKHADDLLGFTREERTYSRTADMGGHHVLRLGDIGLLRRGLAYFGWLDSAACEVTDHGASICCHQLRHSCRHHLF
jgi:hypothetical protein